MLNLEPNKIKVIINLLTKKIIIIIINLLTIKNKMNNKFTS